jgi:hypothetical protein
VVRVRRIRLDRSAGELGEDGQIHVQPDARQTPDPQRQQCPLAVTISQRGTYISER